MSDQITIVGNVAGDPRHTQTPSGIPITTFRVASSPRRFDRTTEKWVDGETNWFSVSAFRALAMNAAASLQRGERVIVTGRLRIRTWEKGDRSGTAVEIDAEAIGHDLLWGTSRFERGGPREAGRPASSPVDAGGWHAPGVEDAGGALADTGGDEGSQTDLRAEERTEEPVPF